MNCEEIKILLSEYLDGELGERECTLVEEHLSDCSDCAKELSGLKNCLNDLGSLKNIEPPPDFLSQVHARLEEKSTFKTAMKRIIFPIRFKIPLEVAGLAAAAMLIVYILNISPEKQSVTSLQMAESKIGRAETDKSLRITGAAISLSRSEEPMMVAKKRRMNPASPPAEVLLLHEETAPQRVDNDETGGGGMGAIDLVILIEPEARDTTEESRHSTALLSMRTRGSRKDKAISSGVKVEGDREAPPLTRLEDLIAREGGEIISTEEMTDLAQQMSIKLPADHYHSFLEELSEISNLQLDQMVPPEESEQTIRIRLIRIMKMKNFHD